MDKQLTNITKCSGGNCPIRHYCFRHINTTKQEITNVFSSIPYDNERQGCEYFWGITEDEFSYLKHEALKYKEPPTQNQETK